MWLLTYFLFAYQPQDNASLVIDNVHVIQPDRGIATPLQTVVITKGRIQTVGPTETVSIPVNAKRIDGQAGYLMPGLWDMHVHLTDATALALPMMVIHGVVGVRDMGGDWPTVRAMRTQVRHGDLIGPRIRAAGPVFDGPKPGVPYRETIVDAESARKAARRVAASGVDFFKVHNGVPREAYFALMDEAASLAKRVDGHIPKPITPLEAAEAGQACFEHVVTCLEGTYAADWTSLADQRQGIAQFASQDALPLFEKLAQKQVVMTPTLVAYAHRHRRRELEADPDPRRKYLSQTLRKHWDTAFPITDVDRNDKILKLRAEGWQHFLTITRRMREADITIMTGSDLGGRDVYPGSSLWDELGYLAEAGFTAAEILRAACWSPPVFLGLSDNYGRIVPGYRASLVLLADNPLEDIDNIRSLQAVYHRDRWLDAEDRTRIAADIAAKADQY